MARMRETQLRRELEETKKRFGPEADSQLQKKFGPIANRKMLENQVSFLEQGIQSRENQAQLEQTQQRTDQIRQDTQQVQQETETLGEQITQQKEEIQGLQRTRRRTVRSALQPNENLFSVLGRSQRSTLG